MDIKKFYFGRALVFFGVLLVLVVMFFMFNSYIYNEKQAGNNNLPINEEKQFEPRRVALSGTFICLPHKDRSGPQTDECAFGLKADNGFNYALDFNLMSQTPPETKVGDKFEAYGVFTPLEMLSTDHWRIYDMVGIFSVTDSVTKLGTTSTSILFPKGGEVLVPGETYTLKWIGGGTTTQIFLIDTSLKSQGTSVSISDRVYNVKNTGTLDYTLPMELKDGVYEIQIGDTKSKTFVVSK